MKRKKLSICCSDYCRRPKCVDLASDARWSNRCPGWCRRSDWTGRVGCWPGCWSSSTRTAGTSSRAWAPYVGSCCSGSNCPARTGWRQLRCFRFARSSSRCAAMGGRRTSHSTTLMNAGYCCRQAACCLASVRPAHRSDPFANLQEAESKFGINSKNPSTRKIIFFRLFEQAPLKWANWRRIEEDSCGSENVSS